MDDFSGRFFVLGGNKFLSVHTDLRYEQRQRAIVFCAGCRSWYGVIGSDNQSFGENVQENQEKC